MTARVGLLLAAALITFFARYPDPGDPKSGRILIDDSHSFEWEQAARRLDEHYYGDFSTYSYTTLAEHLSRCYSVTIVTEAGALEKALPDADVLILKTPEVSFTEQEVDAIQRFVWRGGGLLAIGDHTNLFGMNVRLNALIGRMGLLLRDDSVHYSRSAAFVTAKTPVLGRHPVVAGVDGVTFMTGCSVWSEDAGGRALTVPDALADPADYINSSFFPSWSNDPGGPCGRVGVLATGTWGDGRVAVFTDGTPLSSFEYYKREYPEFTLSMVGWLNRTAGPSWIPVGILVLGLVVLGAAVLASGIRGVLSVGGACAATLGVYAGLGAVTVCGAAYYPIPRELAAPPEVSFVAGGSYAMYPPSLGTHAADPTSVFDTLFNLPLRLGRRCRLASTVDSALDVDVRTLVFVNLVDPPDSKGLVRLEQWVASGGEVIFLQTSRLYGTAGFAAAVEALGLRLELNEDRTPRIQSTAKQSSPTGVIAFSRQHKEGRVRIVVSDDAFCNESLGHSMSVPTDRQAELHRFLFGMFRYEGPRWDLCFVK